MADMNKIRAMLETEIKNWDIPSMAVGIIKDGEILMNEGFGYANEAAGLKADADTVYMIGSCSKAFTAAAMAVLVDQGKVEWDKPARTYLPWLRFKDPYVTEHVTVRDLLCHRTGLPRHDAYWINGDFTREDCVRNLENMQAGWDFRSHWCYQNTCFVAAGMLIEAVTGKSWEEAVQELLFEPLGMNRSDFFVDAMEAEPNHAVGYARVMPTDLNGYEEIPYLRNSCEDYSKRIGTNYGPAGSITSTINDMLKWTAFHLGDGKVGDTQVISEANMVELHKPQMLMSAPLLVPFPEQDFHSYALGWFTCTHNGHKMVEHGGNVNGFSALVTMIPDMKLGIVVLSNFDSNFNTYASTYAILDEFMGTDGNWQQRWKDTIRQVLESDAPGKAAMRGEQITGTAPTQPLENYVGTYYNPTYGNMVIALEDGALQFTYNKGTSPLGHFHYDTFTITDPKNLFSGLNLTFNTDRAGKISAIEFDITLEPACKSEIFTKAEG